MQIISKLKTRLCKFLGCKELGNEEPSPCMIKTLSTFFYVGYLPHLPGTFASFVGVLIYIFLKDNLFIYILFTLVLILLGFLISGKAEKLFNKKDAKCIVIDEVSGIFLTFMFLPYDLRLVIIAFFLFRILDALKPYPADRLEKLKGSIGIMSDDLIAGLYTNTILQILLRWASFKIS